jgi:L-arabinokinase
MPTPLLQLDPVPTLLHRLRTELTADFDFPKGVRVARAPGRLDVMGGIADYTGSLVCEMPLDRAAAVALQPRADRQVQVFSFNLLDDHLPFTLQIPLDALATTPTEMLRKEFSAPGRHFAAYVAGCLHALHVHKHVNLADAALPGLNLAVYSTVPLGAGVSSSAALEVATMTALRDHFGLAGTLDGMQLAVLCQWVENHVCGAPCGVMDQVTSSLGHADQLLKLLCQPHEIQGYAAVPEGMRFVGINSNVKHSVGGSQYTATRVAAFMGHTIVLDRMRAMGHAAKRELLSDPMRGYLANLDPDDYKMLFREHLPESISGSDFLTRFGPTIDTATTVNPSHTYHVRNATDHHVLEAMRVRNFAKHLEHATTLPAGSPERGLTLDKAGHLMYASHLSYTNDARLGAPECDLLVQLVRQREKAGLYGAKITGGGSGGTVAVLLESTPRATDALAELIRTYESQTGRKTDLFAGSSEGAFHTGSALVTA